MSTTPETPTPDYGEPWSLRTEGSRTVIITPGATGADFDLPIHAARAFTCVNACAGMADPAAEIQAMRAAITSSYHMLKYFERFTPNLVDLTEQQWLNTQEGKNTVSALAKLEPFIPDATPTKP